MRFIGFEHYVSILTDSDFWLAAKNTVFFIAVCLVSEFVLGLGMALLLSKEFKGIGIIRILYTIPILLPPISIAIIWRLMLFPGMSVVDYLLGFFGVPKIAWFGGGWPSYLAIIVIDVWQWAPFVALILLAGLLALPAEPYEAARIDGAKPTQIFFNIVLPMLKPIILVVLTLRFLDLIKFFDPIYAVVTGGGSGMETISVYIYKKGFKILNVGFGSAVSVIFWVAAWVTAYLVVRRFKEYIT